MLRLYPTWHNYSLSSPCRRELVNAAAERGSVISIPIRVEDNRERSWLPDIPDVLLEEIVELVKACPKARFILLNGIGYVGCPLGRKDNGPPLPASCPGRAPCRLTRLGSSSQTWAPSA